MLPATVLHDLWNVSAEMIRRILCSLTEILMRMKGIPYQLRGHKTYGKVSNFLN
jgi:hypothetical protein